jgi:RND family efflux transporter MFP subunit
MMAVPRRVLLPAGIVAGCAVVAALLVLLREEPLADVSTDLRPWVQVQSVEPGPLELRVSTQGTVEPRMEIDLISEVAGRVVEMSPALEAGGFFDRDETLIRLDDRDYRAALASAEASVLRQESEAELRGDALGRAESLFEGGVASDVVLDEARSGKTVAEAALRAARASLVKARLDLERTGLRAPFDGRVRERSVGEGQFVAPGSLLARIYAVDFAEVRLPLSENELAYLDLPLAYSAASSDATPPGVTLSTEVAGRAWRWRGGIVRTEGALDPETRMVIAVARVEDPYGRARTDDAPFMPLAVGMFVRAEIEGRRLEQVVSIPGGAWRPDRGVWIVDEHDQLRLRPVRVLRREPARVLVAEGLARGDRVVVSAIDGPIDGMSVRVGTPDLPAEPASAAARKGAIDPGPP